MTVGAFAYPLRRARVGKGMWDGDDVRAALLAPPETDLEVKLWKWMEEGGEHAPLLTPGEARAAMHLLRILASGDGEGHEPAYQLASALRRRLPEEWSDG